jgi:hypothetical protein
MADGPESDRVSVADLLTAFGSRAPAALMLLFAIPNVLPMPPGTSAVLGTPLLFLTLQLALGRPAWVPRAIARRSLARAAIAPAMRRVAFGLTTQHALLRPRLQRLVEPPAVQAIGWASSLLALILFLPIPFGNMLPALAISLFAVGILRRDGAWVLAGAACAAIAVALVWTIGAALGQAAFAALMRIFN